MMEDQLSCLTNCSLLNLSTCQLLPHPFEINLVSYKTKGEVEKSVTWEVRTIGLKLCK